MDGKERGWGGFFRGEKHVNQRTIKIRQPLTRSQHSWLSERVYPYLEQVVKPRNLCPLPRTKPNTQESLLTTENLPQQFFHFFINYRHNPAPLTPARLLFTDSEVKQNIISTLFSHRFVAVRGGKKKRRFQEWLCIHWRSKHSPHQPEPFVPGHCTHQGQEPRHEGLVDVGCSQHLVGHLPLTLICGHLATTCQPNGHQQHLLFHTVGCRQRVNSWQKRGFLSKKKEKKKTVWKWKSLGLLEVYSSSGINYIHCHHRRGI